MDLDDVVGLCSLGPEPDEIKYMPWFNESGQLVGEREKVIIPWNEHNVTLCGFNRPKKRWELIFEPQKRGQLIVFSNRIVFEWHKFASDPAFGSTFERRVALPLLMRDLGRSTLAAQVRSQSMGTVYVLNPKGFLRPNCKVRITFFRKMTMYGLDIDGFSPGEADSFCREIVQRYSRARLGRVKSELKPQDRKILSDNAAGYLEHGKNSWATYYDMPGVEDPH